MPLLYFGHSLLPESATLQDFSEIEHYQRVATRLCTSISRSETGPTNSVPKVPGRVTTTGGNPSHNAFVYLQAALPSVLEDPSRSGTSSSSVSPLSCGRLSLPNKKRERVGEGLSFRQTPSALLPLCILTTLIQL